MSNLRTVPVSENSNGHYKAVSPAGEELPITEELFSALKDFIQRKKPQGTVTIAFRMGGIASVEATEKTVYK